MTNANLNIRTDKEIKEAAENIFAELGLNMTTAVNMFLRQTIRINGIPFELKLSEPNETTVKAIIEGKKIAEDLNSEKYASIDDLRKALEV
ncbi:type II toxin-antitoxin system RelB/DinJ family antitoxin [Gudongella sp. SC589]|uniref:type II toxin-antitoxin system RelB/DinJ family antitoxin n=1 Tax=Gudongella sp. SC589 TaxID=3385990 RepID=UPI0039049A92